MLWSTLFAYFTLIEGSVYLVNNGRHRFIARVCYDGTQFKGCQEQEPRIRTVQGTISNTLTQRYGINSRTAFASRTDLGVHARGQVLHFDLEPHMLTPNLFDQFEYQFNQMLPPDVKVYNLSYAPVGNAQQAAVGDIFHATASSTGKLYIYRFCTNQFVDPIFRNYYSHFYRPMDMTVFEKCLQQFVGTHDFRAYANRIEKLIEEYNYRGREVDTVRTVNSIKLVDEGNGYYRVEVNLQSALYRMIRNMVGTSMWVATGQMDFENLIKLLVEAPSRTNNQAMSAQPQGLTLEHVYYDHY